MALNTVDHKILIAKLSCMGLLIKSLNWFKSYITNRKQQTSCDDELSDSLPVTFRVPQGSVLGPLLFLVFINGLLDAVQHTDISLYADDTVLHCFSDSLHELEKCLNEDLRNVAVWSRENRLTLNLEKTKSMLIGSNRKLGIISTLS